MPALPQEQKTTVFGVIVSGQPFRPAEILAQVALRTFTQLEPGANGETNDLLNGTVRFVLENHGDRISLDDMARHAGLSKYYFLRKFRRCAGITPGAFLHRVRVVHAMDLLVASESPIRHVAEEVGYANAAAFSRAFSRMAGTQPYLYRHTRHRSPERQASSQQTR